MSLHKSLKTSMTDGGHRNVLTRAERLEYLEEHKKREKEDSVLGLPKVRSIKPKTKSKKKAEEGEGEGVATEETAEG